MTEVFSVQTPALVAGDAGRWSSSRPASVREALAQTPTAKVASIEIRGNKKIELPAIQGRLTLKPGDPYTPENVRGQIKILYETGYFEDVQVETEPTPEGIAVTFPRPRETVHHRNRLRRQRGVKRRQAQGKNHDQEPSVSGPAAGQGKRRKDPPGLSRRRLLQRPGHPHRADAGRRPQASDVFHQGRGKGQGQNGQFRGHAGGLTRARCSR